MQAEEEWRKCLVNNPIIPVELWRIFWYQVGAMDELNVDDEKFKNSLKEYFINNNDLTRTYNALAGKENPGKTQQEIKNIAWSKCYEEGKAWYKQKCSALEGMRRFNYAIKGNTNFVEIVQSGHWKVDLLNRQVDEKGVDTSLAVDLVTLTNNYDVAVVFSGDADMIPALNFAKHNGKHVAVIDLIKGYPPEDKGRQSSTRLKSASDFVIPIYEMDLVAKKIAKPRTRKVS